jgi:hypothetical protein
MLANDSRKRNRAVDSAARHLPAHEKAEFLKLHAEADRLFSAAWDARRAAWQYRRAVIGIPAKVTP